MSLLKRALGEIISGPIRGATQVGRAGLNLRTLLGQVLFPPEYDQMGYRLNAGTIPFFGLPRPSANLFEGIAARPPQGLVEIPMDDSIAPLKGIESFREPFIHIPQRNMTIFPKERPFEDPEGIGDAYAHADLASSYLKWIREKGFPDWSTTTRKQFGADKTYHEVPDLYRYGHGGGLHGEMRYADQELGEDWGTYLRPMPEDEGPIVFDDEANVLPHHGLLAALAERYPGKRLQTDSGFIPEVLVRQAKKKAQRIKGRRKTRAVNTDFNPALMEKIGYQRERRGGY